MASIQVRRRGLLAAPAAVVLPVVYAPGVPNLAKGKVPSAHS